MYYAYSYAAYDGVGGIVERDLEAARPAVDPDVVYLLTTIEEEPTFDPETEKLVRTETVDLDLLTCVVDWDVVELDEDELATQAAAITTSAIAEVRASVTAYLDEQTDARQAVFFPLRQNVDDALALGRPEVAAKLITNQEIPATEDEEGLETIKDGLAALLAPISGEEES